MSTPYYPPNYSPGQTPTVVIKPAPRNGVIKIALGIVAALIAILLGLLVLLLIGIETGPVGFLIGLVTATIPVPLYVALVLWIDRYESEPPWMIAVAFFWGALIAVFVAFLLNTIFGIAVTIATNSVNAGEQSAAVISAPIVEECAKAFILFVFFFWKKDEFDGVLDGIVYGSVVALGFAMTENIQYYGKAVLHGGGVLTATFIIRGALAPFSHPLFTSMTGIGLGLARQTRSTAVKFITPVVGLLVAIFLHSIWNGSSVVLGPLGFLVVYVLFMVPAFCILLVVIIVALRREGQVVRQFLLPDVERGMLTRAEYEQLCSIRNRMGASFNAFSSGGVSHWRNRMRLNQMSSELAFLRSRAARESVDPEQSLRDLENAYIHAFQQLINEFRKG